MDKNKYVERFKELISAEFQLKTPAHAEIKNLFPEIKEKIKNIAAILSYPKVDEATLQSYYEMATREYISLNPIEIDPCSSLTKKGFKTWLTQERESEIKWDYTDRYFQLLGDNGRADTVINETRRSSRDIVEKLGDPKSNRKFYVKGLVVGEIQSGKTESFNAVINRAIDSGYGLIIVLSGIMEDLRSQTQKRIENDVVGTGVTDEELDLKGTKGVGWVSRFGEQGDTEVKAVASITSYKTDFKKALAEADFTLDFKNILVCKKNDGVLKNLIIWLHDFLDLEKEGKHDLPLLLVDDEADNASLNNQGSKGREYASKINGHIRALLDLFNRKTYLGYTATPFANVLQDRNDHPERDWQIKYKLAGETREKSLSQVDNIFPDDFIVLLKPPTNYIGAKQIFETVEPILNHANEKIPLVEAVSDHIDDFPARIYENDSGETVGVENYSNKDEWNEKVGEFESYIDINTYREYKRNTRSAKPTDHFPKNLPQSLKDAIMCFILAIAVRESRKRTMHDSVLYNSHNSMLIHVSRFSIWQNTTKKLVEDYVKDISSSASNDNPSSEDSVYFEFERIWYRYYAEIVDSIANFLPTGYVDDFMTPIIFESLKKYIPEAVRGLEVKAINSITKDKLEYPKRNPKKIIAVGGNRLSRGFTLEGLTVNYFIRTTNYSDTLLQMGRWFGYRLGYLDTCKLFTTQDSIDKYNSTTRCIEELEDEFRKMESKDKTPQSFILRVRKHPGVLKITRPSILKNSIDVKWSYQDHLEMTTSFDVRKVKMEKVWSSFKQETAPLFRCCEEKPVLNLITHKITGDDINKLLKKENNFIEKAHVNSMIKFIELCTKNNKLTKWTIAIKTTGNSRAPSGKGTLSPEESNLPKPVGLAIRRGPRGPRQDNHRRLFLGDERIFKATGKSANIVSSNKDFSLLLTDDEIKDAEKEFRKDRKEYYLKKDSTLTEEEARKKADKVNVPERVYRERMKEDEGLLVIYLFDSYYSFNQDIEDPEFKELVENEGYNLNIPIVGYAIGFPPIENDPGGVYAQGDYDLDIDEGEDEDVKEDDSELPSDAQ